MDAISNGTDRRAGDFRSDGWSITGVAHSLCSMPQALLLSWVTVPISGVRFDYVPYHSMLRQRSRLEHRFNR
jgi:hypothetical protein